MAVGSITTDIAHRSRYTMILQPGLDLRTDTDLHGRKFHRRKQGCLIRGNRLGCLLEIPQVL